MTHVYVPIDARWVPSTTQWAPDGYGGPRQRTPHGPGSPYLRQYCTTTQQYTYHHRQDRRS